MDLLRRVCEAGLSLVHVMPDAARQGQLAARQRAALVQIATAGGARPHDLSASLDVSRAAVAYVVDQLCVKGYATRRRGAVAGDRRAVLVEATPDGMQAVLAVMNGIGRQRESLSQLFAEIALWHPPAARLVPALDDAEGVSPR
jgi:DNA-binding MarR family transcriptional regulator